MSMEEPKVGELSKILNKQKDNKQELPFKIGEKCVGRLL